MMGRAVTLLRSVRPALSARRFFADVPAAVEEQLEGELAVVEDTAVAVARRMEQTGAFARFRSRVPFAAAAATALARPHVASGVALRA